MIDYTVPLDDLPDPLPIAPLEKPFDVIITPPGSKSITNRAYVLAALAGGESRIIRPLRSDDCDRLLEALCTLGAEARWDGADVLIRGVNGRFPRGGAVNLGDGGTPTRFMIAAACLAAEPVIVDGSPRMRQRPVVEGVEMLRQLGAKIEYVEQDGRLPVRLTPSDDLTGGELTVGRTASSQFISALMLIAPWIDRGVTVSFQTDPTSRTYLELTEAVLMAWGGTVQGDDRRRRFSGAEIAGREYRVEPDASSAAYWAIAASICAGSRITVHGLTRHSRQPDVSLLGVLSDLGARVTEDASGVSVENAGGSHAAVAADSSVDMSLMPDAAVALGACAALRRPGMTLTGLHTLRVKETDRVAALASELRRIGCTVETTGDSITIDPTTRHDDPVVIETYNDHRMAMAFSVLGLVRPNIAIANPKCVSKSYPTFWRDLATLYR